jgi:signal transduction histidine kinase
VAWQLARERAGLAAAAVCAAALLVVVVVHVRRRLVRVGRIRSLLSLDAPLTGDIVRDALRAITADPDLEIYYRVQDRREFVTSSGELAVPGAPAGTEPARQLIGAGAADEHGCTVLVDAAERGPRAAGRLQRALLDAAAPALANAWLQATLRRQVDELADARARTVRAFLAERRRLEGRLHDGTQAALHETRFQIRQSRLHVTDSGAVACIDAAAVTLNEAIAELRALVRGIYPAGLREGGLSAALFTATSDFPLAVDITGDAGDRIDEETATAGFFTAMDILYIAVRSRARTAKVCISAADGRARIQVAYLQGADMLPAGPGADETDAWLAAEDRVRALEGTMQVTQAQTQVTVEAELPCAS